MRLTNVNLNEIIGTLEEISDSIVGYHGRGQVSLATFIVFSLILLIYTCYLLTP